MHAPLRRVVIHLIVRIDLVPADIRRLRQEMTEYCAARRMALVDLCLGLGSPKQHPGQYDALDYLRRGEADALLITRVPIFEVPKRKKADLLESLFLEGGQPIALVPGRRLRELDLIPRSARLDAQESIRRAAELRADGLSLPAIGRTLAEEGYRTPRGGNWYDGAVTKLLRQAERLSSVAETEVEAENQA